MLPLYHIFQHGQAPGKMAYAPLVHHFIIFIKKAFLISEGLASLNGQGFSLFHPERFFLFFAALSKLYNSDI